eukprot:4114043-Pyramimonas_sp.AAC.1
MDADILKNAGSRWLQQMPQAGRPDAEDGQPRLSRHQLVNPLDGLSVLDRRRCMLATWQPRVAVVRRMLVT